MSWRILQHDVGVTPWPLESGSVQTAVTSPPYWGLRDYGTARWEGGDASCGHKGQPLASAKNTLGDGRGARVHEKVRIATMPMKDTCRKCGAVRVDAQIGLERTPAEYVARLVSVFQELRRVLRDDGTVWLNLGDCFGASSKNLVGIPWRVAFALQDDGWVLRADVVWSKPNPMPESVRDRPTRSHEYVFLLSKARRYYYDQDAIREPYPEATIRRLQQSTFDQQTGGPKDYGEGSNRSARRAIVNLKGRALSPHSDTWSPNGANARTVWHIPTEPFDEAHFATFPTELAKRCVLAGSRKGDLVLDPFAGAGTAVLVADRLGRDALGLELNPEYAEMARRRLRDDAPLFQEPEEAPATDPAQMEIA